MKWNNTGLGTLSCQSLTDTCILRKARPLQWPILGFEKIVYFVNIVMQKKKKKLVCFDFVPWGKGGGTLLDVACIYILPFDSVHIVHPHPHNICTLPLTRQSMVLKPHEVPTGYIKYSSKISLPNYTTGNGRITRSFGSNAYPRWARHHYLQYPTEAMKYDTRDKNHHLGTILQSTYVYTRIPSWGHRGALGGDYLDCTVYHTGKVGYLWFGGM